MDSCCTFAQGKAVSLLLACSSQTQLETSHVDCVGGFEGGQRYICWCAVVAGRFCTAVVHHVVCCYCKIKLAFGANFLMFVFGCVGQQDSDSECRQLTCGLLFCHELVFCDTAKRSFVTTMIRCQAPGFKLATTDMTTSDMTSHFGSTSIGCVLGCCCACVALVLCMWPRRLATVPSLCSWCHRQLARLEFVFCRDTAAATDSAIASSLQIQLN
eukprot:1990383-Amphidinium_carterae.1